MDSDSSEVSPVLQLRISLRGVSPPVWRRLLIPEQITIAHHRDGAFQFFDGPDTLNLAAFGLHEHERFAYVYDFTSWWLHDVRVERRTCNQRSRPLPRCVAGSGRCPPDDAGGPERYMNALEVHGEHQFLEWIETLREGQIDVGDLRVEADEWLIWLDRRFDRRAANERLRTLAR